MNPLLLTSATQLARQIREGEVSSRDVVEAHIEHAKRVNPVLNAVVRDRFEEARAEADLADQKLASQDSEALPPLHGVPCTIKEAFATQGMPHTGGLYARREVVAQEDAPTVSRLRKAGAIVLGVTNVPELCMWVETSNRIYGRTCNPYDPRRIAGGSSGGEGAIVGSGASPFGLGSDVGGSIRLPAFFNGIFGHKPTGGLVPNTGQFPISDGEAVRYLTAGPMARKAEDLMPLLHLLNGPDGVDPGCVGGKLGNPESVDFGSLKVLSIENGTSRDLRNAQRDAAQALARRGATVREASAERFKKAFDIWSSMLSVANETPFGVTLGGGQRLAISRELLRWTARRSNHTLPALVFAGVEPLVLRFPGRLERFVRLGQELKQHLVEEIGENGVLLYPSQPRPAPRHNRPLLSPFDAHYTAIFNVLEVPVTQVPLGLNKAGVPLGVQVAAVHNNDHLSIAVAMELERAFGGWVPPERCFR